MIAEASGATWPAVAPVVIAALAFLGVAIGVLQKWHNDRRERWWDRTQWALSQLSQGGQASTVGLIVLANQGASRLTSARDRAMLDSIGELVVRGIRVEQGIE